MPARAVPRPPAPRRGRVRPGRARPSSGGRRRTLGPKAGATVVRATVRTLVREATLFPEPGATARLMLRCGDTPIERKVSFTVGSPVLFRVTGQDGLGNPVSVPRVAAATGDKGV